MRWRNRYLWALGALAVFAAMLALDGRPEVTASGSGSLSAPFVPSASVESAPVAHFLQSHFDGSSQAFRSARLSFALGAIYSVEQARQIAGPAQLHYGPLHRRPPPSLS